MEPKLKKFVIALVIFGLVAFLANLLVDNPYTHRLLRTVLNTQVERSTNLLVDFKAVKLSLVPPGVDLYGVYVAPKMTPAEPLVTASQVRARVSLWALVLGSLRMAKIEVDDLAVVWPPPWNFPGFLKTDEELVGPVPPSPITWPPDLGLPIDQVVVKNAKVFLEAPLATIPQPMKTLTVAAIGIDAELILHDWRDVRLALAVKSTDLALGPTSMLEDTALDVAVELVDRHLVATKLKIAGQRLNYDGSADIGLTVADHTRLLEGIAVQTAGDVHGDLSLLGSFLDLSDTHGPVSGQVEVKADVPIERAGAATFQIKGKGKVEDGRLYGFRLFNSEAEFAIDEQSVAFPVLTVIVGETPVGVGSGVIKINDAIDFDFRVQPKGLHLLDLLGALKVDLDVVDVVLGSPDLRIAGQGLPLHLNVGATAQFTDVTLPQTPYDHTKFPESPACRIDFHLLVTEAQLDFNGTHGNCFQPAPGKPLPLAKVGELEPPPEATAASPVTFGGQIRLAGDGGLGLAVHSQALDLALGQYFAQVPLAGSGSTETRIVGPFSKVQVEARLAHQGVKVLGMPLGAVSGNVGVDINTKVVSWRNVISRPSEGGWIEAKAGSLDVGAPVMGLTTAFAAEDVSAEAVHALVAGIAPGVDFGLSVKRLDGHFTAPLFFPLAGTGQATLALASGRLGDEGLFDTLRGTVTATPQGFQTKDLVATLGTLAVAAKIHHSRSTPFNPATAETASDVWGRSGLSANDRFEAEFATLSAPKPTLAPTPTPTPTPKSTPAPAGSGHPPSPEGDRDDDPDDHLGRLPFAGPPLREAGIKASIVAQGKVSGTLHEVQGTFTGSLTKPSIFGATIAPVNVKGFLKGSRLDLVVDHSGNALEGRLSLDLMKAGIPYEWFFNFNRMDLRALGSPFFSTDPRNYIYLTADWRMQGHFQDWWRSTGELDIKDLRGKYVQDIAAQTKTMQLRQERPVTLLFTEAGWRFKDAKDLNLLGRDVQLRLSLVDSRPPERLGLRLESVVDLGILRDFSQDVDTAEGKLRVIAEVNGSTAAPRPVVEVTDLKPNQATAATWKPVAIGIADVRPAFRNVRLRVLYEGGKVIIDKLAADKGNGTVTANGMLNLGGESADESHVDLNFNGATVIVPVAVLKSFETQVNGNVVISGKGVPYRIAGDIVINKARSTREMDIRDEIINALRQKSFTTALVAEKPTFLLDLNVSADQSINIHNRNLQMLLSSDLHIKGTDIAPSISGQVQVDKGRFIYKRDFKITRGIVTFDDPVKPDPSLDILAVSDVDVYRVYVAVTGRASNPTVEFSVDPPTRDTGSPITELEILVLLSRGSLPEDNRSLSADTGGALASETANLFLGQFEEPVEKLLGASGQNFVHNVYIDSYPSEQGQPVPRLNLPIDLGEDVDFVLRRDMSTNGATEISLEYNLNENINISGVKQFNTVTNNNSTVDASATGAPPAATNAVPEGDAKVNLKFRFSFE